MRCFKNKSKKKYSINDLNKLRYIYEYDYRVFKTLLFLYWDLECYLENTDNVKHTLKVDLYNLDFLSIKFNNKARSNYDFLCTIQKGNQ